MFSWTRDRRVPESVAVVVLGDFGRSPRMQYHALSLARRGFAVDVVAYKGSEPLEEVGHNPRINFHNLAEVPNFISWFPGLIRYVLKTVWQYFFVFLTLLFLPKVDHLLLQNPPSIPTLLVASVIKSLRHCRLVVDFHNYGYSILALSNGKQSLLVKIAKWCEKRYSKSADACLCVTKAMQEDLLQNWNLKALVFYDCAPDVFHPVSAEDKHAFFLRLKENVPQFQSGTSDSGRVEETRFTRLVDGEVELSPDRPALIVSSTSWTEDEDFSILLSALEDYEQAAKLHQSLPDLLVAITGKGPLKTYYEKQIQDKGFSRIEILTLWLKAEDYPTFLACADLGVSLHTSSSGLDLPMKVVDMFGCCLPVCAIDFPCLQELVKDGVNGRVFKNRLHLSQQFQSLLSGFPHQETDLHRFRDNLLSSGRLGWEENWTRIVWPLFWKPPNRTDSTPIQSLLSAVARP